MPIQAFDYPGEALVFEASSHADSTSQEALTARAIDGCARFCDELIVPLSADLQLGHVDRELGYLLDESPPTHPFWFLRSDEASDNVRMEPFWEQPQTDRAVSIDRSTLRRWIIHAMQREETATAASRQPSTVVAWQEMFIRAVRVSLPHSFEAPGEELQIERGSQVVGYPVERTRGQLFVSGPLHRTSVTTPFELRLQNNNRLVRMTVSVYWSLWTDPRQKGFEALKQAVERLRALDWTCTQSRIEGL